MFAAAAPSLPQPGSVATSGAATRPHSTLSAVAPSLCRDRIPGRHGVASAVMRAAAPQEANGVAVNGALSSADGKISPTAESIEWVKFAIPSYLSSRAGCSDFDQWLRDASTTSGTGEKMDSKEISEMMKRSPVWLAIRSEAERDAAGEPILSSFLWGSILSHDTFERSLAFILANRLADSTMLPTELFDIFYDTLKSSPETVFASMQDCQAAMERDPACRGYSSALLYYKGFHALQAQRCAHVLWKRGRRVLALALQSKVSEVLAIDIHPATQLGHGLLLDHGTGVVIGETAVVGNYCSILQGVTLGGTGKASGDRHPKIGNGVLIGANATVLGNIVVGDGAQIAAGSLVLKPVPDRTMVAGTPAKLLGRVDGSPALEMHQWMKPTALDPYDTTPSQDFINHNYSANGERRRQQQPSRASDTASSSGSESTSDSLDWGSDVDEVVLSTKSSVDEKLGEKLVAQATAALAASPHTVDLNDYDHIPPVVERNGVVAVPSVDGATEGEAPPSSTEKKATQDWDDEDQPEYFL